MATFESASFITIGEYNANVGNRHTPEKIVIDTDYTFLAALHSWEKSGSALKLPIRTICQPHFDEEVGVWVAEFALLDEDMQPHTETEKLFFKNCGMIAITPEFKRADPAIREGCVIDYDDGLGIPELVAATSITIPELISV